MVLYNHELVFHTLQSPLKPALSLGPLGEAQREKMMETVSDFLDGLPTIVSLERKREDGLKNKSTLSEVDDKKKKKEFRQHGRDLLRAIVIVSPGFVYSTGIRS